MVETIKHLFVHVCVRGIYWARMRTDYIRYVVTIISNWYAMPILFSPFSSARSICTMPATKCFFCFIQSIKMVHITCWCVVKGRGGLDMCQCYVSFNKWKHNISSLCILFVRANIQQHISNLTNHLSLAVATQSTHSIEIPFRFPLMSFLFHLHLLNIVGREKEKQREVEKSGMKIEVSEWMKRLYLAGFHRWTRISFQFCQFHLTWAWQQKIRFTFNLHLLWIWCRIPLFLS